MPSWCMPACWACSSADWLTSGFQAGAPAMIGSPQALTTCQRYSSGTVSSSARETGTWVNASRGPVSAPGWLLSQLPMKASSAPLTPPLRTTRRLKSERLWGSVGRMRETITRGPRWAGDRPANSGWRV